MGQATLVKEGCTAVAVSNKDQKRKKGNEKEMIII